MAKVEIAEWPQRCLSQWLSSKRKKDPQKFSKQKSGLPEKAQLLVGAYCAEIEIDEILHLLARGKMRQLDSCPLTEAEQALALSEFLEYTDLIRSVFDYHVHSVPTPIIPDRTPTTVKPVASVPGCPSPSHNALIEYFTSGGRIESRLRETNDGDIEYFSWTRPEIPGFNAGDAELFRLLNNLNREGIISREEVVSGGDTTAYIVTWSCKN